VVEGVDMVVSFMLALDLFVLVVACVCVIGFVVLELFVLLFVVIGVVVCLLLL